MFYRICRFILPAVLLYGCALSPQVVTIAPDIPVDNELPRKSNAISLTVKDIRNDHMLGSRGGVYQDTAVIRTDGDITPVLRQRLAEAFSGLGYRVSDNGDAELIVNLARLAYIVHGDRRINEVETTAAIHVTCRNGDFSMNNDYRIVDRKKVLKAPSESANEQMINDTLSATLQRLLVDQALVDCLDR